MMPEKNVKYCEGDWFGVPLETGGWGIGIVARKGRRDDYIAYFFGPPRTELPMDTKELDKLQPSQAVYRAAPGIIGLKWGTWPILGRHAKWSRVLFPNPWFGWIGPGATHAMREQYHDDVNGSVREPCSIEEALQLPDSGGPGHQYVEWLLGEILAGTARHYGDPRPGTLPWTDKFPPPADPLNPCGYPNRPAVAVQIDPPKSDNALVLDAIAETSDMSKPHTIQRRFYFAARADGIAARKALVKRKYVCNPVIKCDWYPERPWYLEVYQVLVPNADDVDMEDEAMFELAAQFNGEYEGWEAGNVPTSRPTP